MTEMARKMEKAAKLPDMSGWTDDQIDRWLRTHDTTEILKQAIQEQSVNERAKTQVKKHISLRIEPAYIEQAKVMAMKKGIGHQTLIRTLIIEGLVRESKAR
jgi:predicted DNA binding CopG/RHH family protein